MTHDINKVTTLYKGSKYLNHPHAAATSVRAGRHKYVNLLTSNRQKAGAPLFVVLTIVLPDHPVTLSWYMYIVSL